ncbi:amino acid permease [Catenulispora rubra]|uniref:amino acid permease n=1 Tax=Catenulispora rubra TaxID=280293 RepID=UPI0034DD66B5
MGPRSSSPAAPARRKDTKGVQAFIGSSSLVGDLGTLYVGGWAANLVTLGARVGAFGSALACAVGASRLLFALGRDGLATRRLGVVRERDGVPSTATRAVLAAVALILVALRATSTSAPPMKALN